MYNFVLGPNLTSGSISIEIGETIEEEVDVEEIDVTVD